MEGYASHGNVINLKKYAESKAVDQIDKIIAMASQHVQMDSQQTFAQLQPAIAQLMQMMQQFAPKPQMTGSDMALLQAAQMETQRKTAKDQQDGQLDMAKQQDESQRKILELQQKTEEAEKDRQANFALNTQDNLTQERIKAADLTVDGAKLRQEQMKTVREANREVQQNLGE
jgi:hypothetical protein